MHCFVYVLSSLFDVIALCSVLCVFCFIVWYVSALHTVLNVLCKICSFVSVLRTVLNMLSLVFFTLALRTPF